MSIEHTIKIQITYTIKFKLFNRTSASITDVKGVLPSSGMIFKELDNLTAYLVGLLGVWLKINLVLQVQLARFAITNLKQNVSISQTILVPDKTVISASADIAPANTVILGCRMAIIAAIKKVLSPNSETIITDKDATKAWTNSSEQISLLFFSVDGLAWGATTVGGMFSSTGNEQTAAAMMVHNTITRENVIFIRMSEHW